MTGNSIRDTFFEECEDLLDALAEGLARMEGGEHDDETVNAVFRSVHSIKGGAGAFGLDRVVSFAHTFETVLDMLRDKKLTLDEPLLSLFFKSNDQLSDLVASARDETDLDEDRETRLVAELEAYLGPSSEPDEFSFDAISLDFGTEAQDDAQCYTIRFAPRRGLYANGHEPLLLFDALAELGKLSVELDDKGLPGFDSFDPDDAYLTWTMTLESTEAENRIVEVFEFVEGLCELSIRSEAAPETTPEPTVVVPDAVMNETGQCEEKPIASPAKSMAKPEPTPKGPKPTLRVDLERVDRLINTVGELIINQAMVSQRIEELELPTGANLSNELEAYKLLARDIQEGVMAIRAQPVKPLFQRMTRIVREASEATGKKARLTTVGDATEVDKTVIERLADPLTHMIRNAVDHGLEDPEHRRSAGKPEVGTIRLSAAHRSGSVFIEISDDGAGINRDKILQKAIDKGFVGPGDDLTDQEIDNLLFLPGFSTAGSVSNLSGRGVGMDVVKTAVQALGGRITMSSAPNEGTSFSIVLPLTLAVMDGFVISVASETMVVPITAILETLRPSRKNIHRIGEQEYVKVRGSYLPIIDVADKLGLGGASGGTHHETLLLVSSEGKGLVALSVGAIHDQRQVVVKSLENNFVAIPGVSAATILGDGRIALILDPDELIRISHNESPPKGRPEQNMESEHA